MVGLVNNNYYLFSRKISADLRRQVLFVLEHGACLGAIAAQIKVSLSRARESRLRFEQGDIAWRDPAHREWASPENALLAL